MEKEDIPQRLIYDLSSLARWTGHAAGIARTDRELALWVRKNRPDAVFSFFCPERQIFCTINPSWIGPILTGNALIDQFGMPSPRSTRQRPTARLPKSLRSAALWILKFRRKLVGALERLRLKQRREPIGIGIERIQNLLISNKYRSHFFTPEGRRRSCVPYDVALGPELTFTSADTLFSVGSAWVHLNVDAIRRLKDSIKLRFIFFCHDLIPLQFPQYFRAHDVQLFREHFHVAVSIADFVIFSTLKIEADARTYCRSNGLAINRTAVRQLGADALRVPSVQVALPSNLTAGRYALFVSTIEPRKSHGMLYRVWRRLLIDGVPQTTNFKLVFVGRVGWMVNEMLEQIYADEMTSDSLLIMSNVEDSLLSALYEGAAFCLYPSLYEGFGLPLVEAFSRGKATIASTGGAIPEVVGEFSPCLDPTDEDAWYTMLKQWIIDREVRKPYENAIRTRYRHLTWHEAAYEFFRPSIIWRA
jgi:glycosyltransferase involved in cell wall biosynthesis